MEIKNSLYEMQMKGCIYWVFFQRELFDSDLSLVLIFIWPSNSEREDCEDQTVTNEILIILWYTNYMDTNQLCKLFLRSGEGVW